MTAEPSSSHSASIAVDDPPLGGSFDRRQRWLQALPMLAILVGATATAALALMRAAPRTYSLQRWSELGYATLIVTLCASLLLAVIASVITCARIARGGRIAIGTYRFGFVVFVGSAALWIVAFPPFKATWFLFYESIVGGVLAGAVLLGPAIVARLPNRLVRGLDRVAFQFCLVLVLLELALRVVSLAPPSPVFAAASSSQAAMAPYRMEPGQLYFGFRCDSKGFYDRPPQRRPGSKLITAIGDSFGLGIVPYDFNYLTLTERALHDTEIYNVGLGATGPSEYLHLLREDALPLEPDLVLLCLFLGNDISESERHRQGLTLVRRFFDRGENMLALVASRTLALQAERAARASVTTGPSVVGAGLATGDEIRDIATLEAMYPWLTSWSAEQPTLSAAKFESVEINRAHAACDPTATQLYSLYFAALAAFHEMVGERQFAVVLIPDEFQVEDSLWQRIVTANPEIALERDRPQRLTSAWLEARGIPYLDLLPVFRAAPATADGDRHLYHLRDTHWNRRGNALAAQALTEFLRTRE